MYKFRQLTHVMKTLYTVLLLLMYLRCRYVAEVAYSKYYQPSNQMYVYIYHREYTTIYWILLRHGYWVSRNYFFVAVLRTMDDNFGFVLTLIRQWVVLIGKGISNSFSFCFILVEKLEQIEMDCFKVTILALLWQVYTCNWRYNTTVSITGISNTCSAPFYSFVGRAVGIWYSGKLTTNFLCCCLFLHVDIFI